MSDHTRFVPMKIETEPMLFGVPSATEPEREDFSVEIDDGSLVVRFGSLSITVFAETATLYDTSKNIPAKRVPLSRYGFWEPASEFLATSPETPPAPQEEKEL